MGKEFFEKTAIMKKLRYDKDDQKRCPFDTSGKINGKRIVYSRNSAGKTGYLHAKE